LAENKNEAPKRNEKELKDINAMVSELNKVIMNLDLEHNHQNDADHLQHEIKKEIERDDDPDHVYFFIELEFY